MDGQFDSVEEFAPETESNMTEVREHVTEIERSHRAVKERCRAISSTMPFAQLLDWIRIHLAHFVVLCLNAFPHENGVCLGHKWHAHL